MPAIGNSDHDIVLYDTNMTPTRPKPTRRKILLWKRADLPKIRENISQHQDEVTRTEDVETAWQNFKKVIAETMDKFVPAKWTTPRNSVPWMNTEIRRAIKRKQRAHRKARQTKRKKDKDRYTRLQKEVKYKLKEANKVYMQEVISNNLQGDSRKFWSFVKSKKQESSGVSPLKDKDGYIRSDSNTRAEILNSQFQSAYTRENIQTFPDLGPSPYPDMPNIRVHKNGVLKLLQTIKPYKATGPDDIPAYILKAAAEEISPILTKLFHLSLDTGQVPKDWKEAMVVPAFKKGDKSLAENYRPISLTSVTCKLLEHIVHTTIINHFEKHKILTDTQHGFRKRRSCESQLIITINDIARRRAGKNQVDIILLDFSKAFDKVPHKRLLQKLQHYGIKDSTLNWIASFLENRKQRVAVDGHKSSDLDVLSGVPQGTVLGPLLFLAYINDLPTWAKNSQTRLFADDTLLYRTINTPGDAILLQEDLNALEEWEDTWQMRFNPAKCNVITIRPSRKEAIPTTYTLHGQILNHTDASKYLGVKIHKDLSWSEHIDGVVGNANRNLGFLRRNFRDCTAPVKTTLYTTMVRPKLEYAAAVWDPTTKTQITAIEQVQRRAARYVYNNYREKTPGCVTKMIENLHWESLETRRRQIRLTTLYKIINNLIDIDNTYYLQSNDRRTRGHNKLFQERIDNPELLNSFFPRTIRDWNATSTFITSADTLDIFRQRLSGSTQSSSTP